MFLSESLLYYAAFFMHMYDTPTVS